MGRIFLLLTVIAYLIKSVPNPKMMAVFRIFKVLYL